MKIKGLERTSLIDYPGKVSSVVFLPNCNFRCPYCQNSELVLNPNTLQDISEEDLWRFLYSKEGWIDALVVTGGEPTLHQDLPAFLQKVKNFGLLTKLDTNGTNPSMLESLINKGLLDYIAMDIKSPREKYPNLVGAEVNPEDLERSIHIITTTCPDYEFRTTVVPPFFQEEDALAIASWLNGSKHYCLQQFRPANTLDKSFSNIQPYPREQLEKFQALLEPYFDTVEVRA